MATIDLGKVVGDSASVNAGTTTTLQAGLSATVENVGTTQNAIFNFGIPRGADGTNGTDGVDGFSPSASVSQSGNITTITITDKNGTSTASIDLSQVGGGADIQEMPKMTSSTGQIVVDNLGKSIFTHYDGGSSVFRISYNNTSKQITDCVPLLFVMYKTIAELGTITQTQYFSALYYIATNISTGQGKIYIRHYGIDSSNQLTWMSHEIGQIVSSSYQQYSGLKKFSVIPECSLTPTTNDQLTNKSYVDSAIASAITTTLGGSY